MDEVFVKCELEVEPTKFPTQISAGNGNASSGSVEKCGDIFLFDGDKFSFSCYFCNEKFEEYEKFTGHIKEDHSKMFIQEDEDFPSSPGGVSLDEDMKQDIEMENNDLPIAIAFPVTSLPIRKRSRTKKSRVSKNTANKTPSANIVKIEKQTEKKFSCDVCRAKFFTEVGMLKHRKNHLSGEEATQTNKFLSESLDCRYCSRIFDCKANRIKHESVHTGEKPYQCPVCFKCFRRKHRVGEHMRIHTGERPYKCEFCKAAFAQQPTLKDHIRRAHLIEKRYKCEFCEKSFVTSTDKIRHVRTHTGENPFQCEECGARFNCSSSLGKHKQRRHDARPKEIECNVCGKMFLTNSCLKRHMVSHTGEKPFKCEICSASFARQKSLKTHLQTHAQNSLATEKEYG